MAGERQLELIRRDSATVVGYIDPANAAAYQRELAAKGLPATIQSRVVLGPFADRAAAEKAQAALRKAGQDAGMLLPPARKKP